MQAEKNYFLDTFSATDISNDQDLIIQIEGSDLQGYYAYAFDDEYNCVLQTNAWENLPSRQEVCNLFNLEY